MASLRISRPILALASLAIFLNAQTPRMFLLGQFGQTDPSQHLFVLSQHLFSLPYTLHREISDLDLTGILLGSTGISAGKPTAIMLIQPKCNRGTRTVGANGTPNIS